MIDLRRVQLEQILAQAKEFLQTEPIPRMHSQVDPEKSFSGPTLGDYPTDDFLDAKDRRGKKYLLELSQAMDRANALLQAFQMYSDVRSEERADLHTQLLNRKTALIEEIERFDSHNISPDEKQAFTSDVRSLQDFVQIKGFGMDKPLPTPKSVSKKMERELSGAGKEVVQCKRCSAYVEISGTPPATLPGQVGPKLLVPEVYCPVCGHPIARGTGAERVRI